MSRPPTFFEHVHLSGGPLDGASVLIGLGHHVIQVHTQTPYNDQKSDQIVETHRYHYIRTLHTIRKYNGTYAIFEHRENTIP